jgi:hypothetical protein
MSRILAFSVGVITALACASNAGAVVYCAKKKNPRVVTVRGGDACKKNETSIALPTTVGPAGTNGKDAVSPVVRAKIPLMRATATAAATADAARLAAPKVVLFAKGPLSIYAKCFRDTTAGQTFAAVYAETSVPGTSFSSNTDTLDGGATTVEFLNPDTLETDREIRLAGAATSDFDGDDESFTAVAPDGTALRGGLFYGVQNVTGALGGGAYGAGSTCLWGGHMINQ